MTLKSYIYLIAHPLNKRNNPEQSHEKTVDVLREIATYNLLPHQRKNQTLFSDLEFISLDLTAGYTGIDSKNDLFRKLPQSFSERIERSVTTEGSENHFRISGKFNNG